MQSKSSAQAPAFDISVRIDGRVNVWAWLPWPDADLDNNSGRLALFMRNTLGWRSYGWQIVHVAASEADAQKWLVKNPMKKG